MLNRSLLYNMVIEGDGKVHREETFLGASLTFLVLLAGLVTLVVLFL